MSSPPSVSVVLDEDGNSLAIIDPAESRVLAVPDVLGALDEPHLAAFDPANRRLDVGNKGAHLAVFDLHDPLAPELVANLRPDGDGEIHWSCRPSEPASAGFRWVSRAC